MNQLTFNLETFKGPLDLLLVLIKKNKVNIYDIPISEILDQYLQVMAEMKELDLEVSSEFLVLAATLLQIKSRMLLPKDEDEAEEEDPREELVKRLLEYKAFKEKAEFLKTKENEGYKMFFKLPEAIEAPPVIYDYTDLDGETLLKAYKTTFSNLERKMPPPKKSFSGIVGHEKVSVREKVRKIWKKIINKSKVLFKDIFTDSTSKPEAVASFLAVLELIKLKKIRVEGDRDNCTVILSDKDADFNLEGVLEGIED